MDYLNYPAPPCRIDGIFVIDQLCSQFYRFEECSFLKQITFRSINIKPMLIAKVEMHF